MPMRAMRSTRAGTCAAHSSAISEPIEWPTIENFSAGTALHSHSAIPRTDETGDPPERPCPGRSYASTFQP
jgi:hypothetical protein